MSQKKHKQEKQTQHNKKNLMLPLLCGAFTLAVAVMVAVIIVTTPHTPAFTPPPFDENAVVGTPEGIPEELGYTEHYREGMAYSVSTCTAIRMEGMDALVYFTSSERNEKYVKLRILDADGNILGDTGLLRPGEYVRTVALSRELSEGEVITLKVMGYEPESYQSAGSVRISVSIVK